MKIVLMIVLVVSIYADSVSDKFFNSMPCDIIVDSGIYNTCYIYNKKGPLAVSYVVNKYTVDKINLNNKIDWKIAQIIPKEYRQYGEDYFGTNYDKGHLASDRYFDYDIDTLKKTYILGLNSVPMNINLNRSRWRKAENRVVKLLETYEYVNVIDVIIYGNKTIGNGVHVPNKLFKVLYNNNMKECYQYDAISNNVLNDVLSDHVVNCYNMRANNKINVFK